ncbi:MAG TPA: hypothetical protein VMK32_05420 [Burkholderiaceae bacterium]|jgi:hypothetical protein|nr:hypothetical protein [Burkholderiaceae bacterium]
MSRRKTQTTHLPYGIIIERDSEGNAYLSSDLHDAFVDEDDGEEARMYGHIAADAMEGLLMALVAAGVDLNTSAAQVAVETAVEGLANYLVHLGC